MSVEDRGSNIYRARIISQPSMQFRFESTVARDRFVASQMWMTAINFHRHNPDAKADDLKEYLMGKKKYQGLSPELVGQVIDKHLEDLTERQSQRMINHGFWAVRALRETGLAS